MMLMLMRWSDSKWNLIFSSENEKKRQHKDHLPLIVALTFCHCFHSSPRLFSSSCHVIWTIAYRSNELRFTFASVWCWLIYFIFSLAISDWFASLGWGHVRLSLILTTSMDASLSQTCIDLIWIEKRKRWKRDYHSNRQEKKTFTSLTDKNPFVSS